MKTFEDFLNEEYADSSVVKGIRKAIGKGKTQSERGSHWLHASPDETRESLVSKVSKTLGKEHTTDQHGRTVWKTGTHEVMMYKHGDGHHFFQVSKE